MKKLFSLFAVVAILSQPLFVFAAGPRINVTQSGNFSVRITADSDEPINAFDVELAYPADIVDVVRIDSSKSIISIFPVPIRADKGRIVIKGGSSTAFVGTGGELVTLYLKPLAVGAINVSLVRANVYQADGTGKQVAAALVSRPIAVTDASLTRYEQGGVEAMPTDVEAPKITLARIENNAVEDTPPLVVLQAEDLGSGVSEFRARTKSWFAWSDWRQAANPYPLSGGEWAIEIAALDNSANAVTQILYRPGIAVFKGLIVLAGLALAGLIVLKLRRRNKQRNVSSSA